MRRLLSYAKTHNSGGSHGNCFNYVWRYMANSKYGKIVSQNSLPNMPSNYARNFADYLNASPAHLQEAGLQRITGVTNPFDPKIPAGAVVVVGPGSTGTSHPVAGDITVKGENGQFINDGPSMGSYMGNLNSWRGTLLGAYVPL